MPKVPPESHQDNKDLPGSTQPTVTVGSGSVESIVDLLAQQGAEDVEFEPPLVQGVTKPPAFRTIAWTLRYSTGHAITATVERERHEMVERRPVRMARAAITHDTVVMSATGGAGRLLGSAVPQVRRQERPLNVEQPSGPCVVPNLDGRPPMLDRDVGVLCDAEHVCNLALRQPSFFASRSNALPQGTQRELDVNGQRDKL